MSLTYVDALAGEDGLEGLGDMGADDVLGELGIEELGARARSARKHAGASRSQRQAAANVRAQSASMPVRALVSPIAGVPSRGLRKSWLPFSAVLTFISTAPANPQNLVIQPQKPFRPTRQVYTVGRTGATSTGLLSLTGLDIGTNRQQAGIGFAPLEAFQPNAFDVDVDLDPASTSITVTAGVQTTLVPTAPDNITVAGLLVGYMIG